MSFSYLKDEFARYIILVTLKTCGQKGEVGPETPLQVMLAPSPTITSRTCLPPAVTFRLTRHPPRQQKYSSTEQGSGHRLTCHLRVPGTSGTPSLPLCPPPREGRLCSQGVGSPRGLCQQRAEQLGAVPGLVLLLLQPSCQEGSSCAPGTGWEEPAQV